MKKSKTALILLVSILLISSGVIAVVLLGNDPLAKIASDNSQLDRLKTEIGVTENPSSTNIHEVRLKNTAGRYVALDDFRGKIVLLNFWATWCPSCIIEMPSMEKLHRKLFGKNFAMVTVNIQESAAQVKNFFDKNKLSFTALLDPTGEVATEFGIRGIPTSFIIDKSGKIIGQISGPREWDSKNSVTLFEQLAKK